jgi:hypothetical protein
MRHVSILGLMVFVLACGVGTAALIASTAMWDRIVFSATLLILTAAILLAVVGRRAFWLGFSLFGWAYLVSSLIPLVESRLLSTKGLAYLDAKTANRQSFPVAIAFSGNGHSLADLEDGSIRIWDAQTGKPIPRPTGSFANFCRIGHSLLALLAGLIGGFMGTGLHNRSVFRPSGVRD